MTVNERPGSPVGEAPQEKCGVFAAYLQNRSAAATTYYGLFALQHRGQETAGIVTSDGENLHKVIGRGLVNTVFTKAKMKRLKGHLAIGHTRYSTTGGARLANAQPINCMTNDGNVAIAHNGNLVNTDELRAELEAEGETFEPSENSDSHLIARIIARHIHEGPMAAVKMVMERCVGAYSIAVITPTQILGFRDPWGVRPLVLGRREDDFYIASETCAFRAVGATFMQEIQPGQMVTLDENGYRIEQVVPVQKESLCLFEFIYFARPDSKMYGRSLYSARKQMGIQLAYERPAVADLVVPVPDSGIPAALGFSKASGIPFAEGMMKSRYIHRTFIEPDDEMRKLGVRMKLSPLEDNIEGKRIVLVDDSIVRGNTTGEIVKLLREYGAREIHVRITAPRIEWPCYYGIDMSERKKLIAALMTNDEICTKIGADSLGFLSLEQAHQAVGVPDRGFCDACFSNNYPIEIPAKLKARMTRMPKIKMVEPDQKILLPA